MVKIMNKYIKLINYNFRKEKKSETTKLEAPKRTSNTDQIVQCIHTSYYGFCSKRKTK
jgi:hypothetical protein